MKGRNNFHWFVNGAILIILVIICFRIYSSKQEFIRSRIITFLSFGEKIEQLTLPTRRWFDDLLHFNRLRKIAQQAEKEKIDFLQEQLENKQLKQENDILRQALQLRKENPWEFVLAKVLFTDPLNLKGNFWIDKGLNDGLKEGMNVVIGKKVLVGRLVKCLPSFCEGVSILQPGFRLGVRDERSSALAIAEVGDRGGFYLKLVSAQADVKEGDIIVTSKENAGFLPGLLVARVGKQQSPPANFLKEFSLQPFFTRSDLSFVLIISNEVLP